MALVLGASCGDGGDGGDSAEAIATDSTVTTAAAPSTTVAVDDGAALEARMVEQMRQQAKDLTIESADCPEGPPEGDVGATTSCTVRAEGVDVPFTVTLLADNAQTQGGAHNYQIELARPLVNISALVDSIRAQAATQLKVAPGRLQVECGASKIQVLDVGATIPCTVASGGTTRRLVATVTDDQGSVQVSEPAPPKG